MMMIMTTTRMMMMMMMMMINNGIKIKLERNLPYLYPQLWNFIFHMDIRRTAFSIPGL